MKKLFALVALIAIVAVACGDDDTADVEDARDKFCDDSASYIETLDQYGLLLGDEEITVGAVRTSGEEFTEARETVEKSAEELRKSVEAAEESDEDEIPEDFQVTEETLDFVEEAQTTFDDALDGIDDDTLLSEATVIVTSAAFQLEIAWIALFDEAGCIADSDSFASDVIDYVKALQTDLATAGYYAGEIDGIYGPETIAAVEALQEDAGLPVTGLMDPATQQALTEKLAGQESAFIAALQGLMVATGYYTGPVDGVMSDALDAAVKTLQSDYGLEPNGVIDAATLRAIHLAIAANAPTTSTTAAPSSTTAAPTTSAAAAASTTVAPQPTAAPTPVPSSTDEPAPTTTAAAEAMSLLEVLKSQTRFDTYVGLVETAGLEDELTGGTATTLFVPTNKAFDALPDGTLDDLVKPENSDELVDLLRYHASSGTKLIDQLLEAGTTETLLPDVDIEIGTDGSDVVINTDQAGVIDADIEADNGVVHAIDGVLSVP